MLKRRSPSEPPYPMLIEIERFISDRAFWVDTRRIGPIDRNPTVDLNHESLSQLTLIIGTEVWRR